ncbi:YbhB/YbcL family Raf kinase inhibitor-like protein [Marinicellulosiphila megalodicopiae]|uniref:YbhB/YbcL family Raf kinase inhibitor-like protein n=1 Tax=Marinicellulosiphila megalodicopiae TaxID=2724896 RepID=UPI003BAEEAFA
MQFKLKQLAPLLTCSFLISQSAFAQKFTLTSQDIQHNKFMDSKHEFNGFGCTGDDQSAHLKWENPPKGTKSFAITVYDPDAPTGSGWWHWQVVNIPLTINEIQTNSGKKESGLMPANSQTIRNDYGVFGFGGACPPSGHGVHHYQFTVHALSVEKIELPIDASGALTGYMIHANSIESSTIETFYSRE